MNLNRSRFPLLAMAIVSLLSALWAGWIRLGWKWPALQPTLPGAHGPLMIAGFLGTLIALERAVALKKPWMYVAPLLSGLGGLVLIFGWKEGVGALLITTGSLGLVFILASILRQVTAPYTITMALAALAFFVGNVVWLFGWSIPRLVPWWCSFLVLTIAGERLELGRLLRLSPWIQRWFNASVLATFSGLGMTFYSHDWGTRLVSLGMFTLSLWLLINDIARHTVRQKGLPRFVALCLLAGYVWLGFGSLLGLVFGGMAAGPRYDAYLHSIMVGFVISMIFGHAPIIFPAVLQRPIAFSPLFYGHLILLHLSLLLRVGADLATFTTLRLWGGFLNGVAILLFLFNTARIIGKGHITATTVANPKPPSII